MSNPSSSKEYNTDVFQSFLMQKGFVNKVHIGLDFTNFEKCGIVIQIPRSQKLSAHDLEDFLNLSDLSLKDFEEFLGKC